MNNITVPNFFQSRDWSNTHTQVIMTIKLVIGKLNLQYCDKCEECNKSSRQNVLGALGTRNLLGRSSTFSPIKEGHR